MMIGGLLLLAFAVTPFAMLDNYSPVGGWFIFMLGAPALLSGVCFLEAARVLR